MKVKKFYICDKQFAVACGYCNGNGCSDIEIDSIEHCKHTTNPMFARYSEAEQAKHRWVDVVIDDYETGLPIIARWEVDPYEKEEDLNLN